MESEMKMKKKRPGGLSFGTVVSRAFPIGFELSQLLGHSGGQSSSRCANPHPVILVPGIAGSAIHARYEEEVPQSVLPHRHCPSSIKEWQRLWISTAAVIPEHRDCLIYMAALQFRNGSFSSASGVTNRVPFWEQTRGIDTLYPLFPGSLFSRYFHYMIRFLENLGYEEGKDLFGAPYDWRHMPTLQSSFEDDEFMRKFKQLVERAYNLNNGKQVVIISHSLGSPIIYKFLIKQPLEWRKQYIHLFVPMATPWLGSVDVLKAFLSGNNFGVPFVPPEISRDLERTFPSCYYLLPNPYATNSIFGKELGEDEEWVSVSRPIMQRLKQVLANRDWGKIWALVSGNAPPELSDESGKRWCNRSLPGEGTLAKSVDRSLVHPLVVSPQTTYTAFDYRELFVRARMDPDMADYGVMAHQKLNTLSGTAEEAQYSEPPGVPVFMLYSTGRKTLTWIEYEDEDLSNEPLKHYGPGDGTATVESLRYAGDVWKKAGTEIKMKEFSGIRHHRMMGNQDVLESIKPEICN